VRPNGTRWGRIKYRWGGKEQTLTAVASCTTLAHRMDQEAIRRAALITLRRAICERFPPGRERRAWLAWAQRLQTTQPVHKRRRRASLTPPYFFFGADLCSTQ
jgi:hypothetical protein